MKIKTRLKQGFTLIELMITVAIVGILAAVALPAYQDYIIKAQTSEGLILAEGMKTAVAEYHANKGAFPVDTAAAGTTSQTGKYVSGTAIASGVITATFNSNVHPKLVGKTIVLTPVDTATNLTWACTSTALQKYVPTSCTGV